MKNLDKKQVVILGLVALVVCGIGVVQYVPIIHQKHKLQKGMAQQAKLYQEICSQDVWLPELKYREKQCQDKLELFSKRIPETRNFAQLWQQIADAMNDCKLTEQLVQPGEELKSDQICSIPLTFECQGSLEQLFAFFQALEGLDRLIRIDEVTFSNDTNFSSIINLNAKASVYYQPEQTNNG